MWPCSLPTLFLGRLFGQPGQFEREGEEVEKEKTETNQPPSHHSGFLVLRAAVKDTRKSDQRQESDTTEYLIFLLSSNDRYIRKKVTS